MFRILFPRRYIRQLVSDDQLHELDRFAANARRSSVRAAAMEARQQLVEARQVQSDALALERAQLQNEMTEKYTGHNHGAMFWAITRRAETADELRRAFEKLVCEMPPDVAGSEHGIDNALQAVDDIMATIRRGSRSPAITYELVPAHHEKAPIIERGYVTDSDGKFVYSGGNAWPDIGEWIAGYESVEVPTSYHIVLSPTSHSG